MLTLQITPDGAQPYSVTATARDILSWEKSTKGSKTFIELMASPTMVDLYRIAHLACWRQGLFTGNQREFEDSCEVTFEEETEEPDPTEPEPSTGR
ncbi:hypothetical protein [Kribbella italica]|uniref:Uncharacterized protein n=1 Tax=Kribbella italica TaxID=1540520 RepID=A0A7W9MW76_9ACTN|nr:hypothetical protein [Kribbella italica]MBB5838711.1 hypothetical protein [Kribbella italica]